MDIKIKNFLAVAIVVAFVLSHATQAALPNDSGVYMMPMNCQELLPDSGPYIRFFEAVGRGNVASDPKFAKKVFRILALRERIAETVDRAREQNPIDSAIRKTICFYREQKEPIQPIPFDDPKFQKFVKDSIKELEGKVDDLVFETEFDRIQRKEYERKVEQNRGLVDSLRREADRDADFTFDKLSAAARKKVRAQ